MLTRHMVQLEEARQSVKRQSENVIQIDSASGSSRKGFEYRNEILCISMFFSVHYLTIYYLLQPFNAGTEIKSGTYRVVVTGTYLVCYGVMQMDVPTFVFGMGTVVFCVAYCVIACVLVYKLAPKTFRLRA